MNFRALTAALATGLLAYSGSASAYLLYFGEDVNDSATVPLTSIPNSSGAASSFMSKLSGVGTETFEGIDPALPMPSPLTLSFPGGPAMTAELIGSGAVQEVPKGSTDGAGRYSIPSATSTRYYEAAAGTAGNFEILFGQAISAFGFYGIDIGDFGGQVAMDFYNGSNLVSSQTLVTSMNPSGLTDGSVLYFGIIAANSSEDFTRIVFRTTPGTGDVFAFDDFTIGNRAQINDTPPTPTPIPGTLLLAGLGLAGLGAMRRRAR